MITEAVERHGWSRRRWWGTATGVFVVQVGLIFWLSDRVPLRPRLVSAAPTLRLGGKESAEVLDLLNPTLFALPQQQGFAGKAWMKIPAMSFHPFEWHESASWLDMDPQSLGAAFRLFTQTNSFQPSQELARYSPKLLLQNVSPLEVSREGSSVRLVGAIASRQLLAPLAVQAWTNNDLLTNTVVQILVDARGRTVSATLLSSSGSVDADRFALEQARGARFNPLSGNPASSSTDPLAGLIWGKVIFEWMTLPMETTNAIPSTETVP